MYCTHTIFYRWLLGSTKKRTAQSVIFHFLSVFLISTASSTSRITTRWNRCTNTRLFLVPRRIYWRRNACACEMQLKLTSAELLLSHSVSPHRVSHPFRTENFLIFDRAHNKLRLELNFPLFKFRGFPIIINRSEPYRRNGRSMEKEGLHNCDTRLSRNSRTESAKPEVGDTKA